MEDGSAEHPFLVFIVETLNAIPCNQAGFLNRGLTHQYKLLSDVDLSGMEWVPIKDGLQVFSGSFNGNGHAIRNISISSQHSGYIGLFASIDSAATIHNLRLENAQVQSNFNGSALLVGNNNGTIRDVQVQAASQSQIGGLLGGINNVSTPIVVIRSFYDAQTSGYDAAGGVSGSWSVYGTAVSTASMLSRSTYANGTPAWDFATVWAILPDINGGYPHLIHNRPDR